MNRQIYLLCDFIDFGYTPEHPDLAQQPSQPKKKPLIDPRDLAIGAVEGSTTALPIEALGESIEHNAGKKVGMTAILRQAGKNLKSTVSDKPKLLRKLALGAGLGAVGTGVVGIALNSISRSNNE